MIHVVDVSVGTGLLFTISKIKRYIYKMPNKIDCQKRQAAFIELSQLCSNNVLVRHGNQKSTCPG